MPLDLMRCLARLMRWAIVASGTRKARAISAVVSPPPARLFAAHLVGQPARSDRYQPALRILGDTLRRPLDGGGEQRFLHRVLSQVEIAVTPDERAENPRRELAQQVLDSVSGSRPHISVPASSMIGRTSTPQNRAAGS